MSRLCCILGISAIVICALSLYRSLDQSARGAAADPLTRLNVIRHSLADSGLRSREDVSIKINGRDVALGFSRPGCDGMMLVAILPHTAQSWAHMAPRLDLSSFHLGYFYKGEMHRAAPRLERLASRLGGDLIFQPGGEIPQVVAIAETGHCSLVANAAPALEAASQGLQSSLGYPERPVSTGGDSA